MNDVDNDVHLVLSPINNTRVHQHHALDLDSINLLFMRYKVTVHGTES